MPDFPLQHKASIWAKSLHPGTITAEVFPKMVMASGKWTSKVSKTHC